MAGETHLDSFSKTGIRFGFEGQLRANHTVTRHEALQLRFGPSFCALRTCHGRIGELMIGWGGCISSNIVNTVKSTSGRIGSTMYRISAVESCVTTRVAAGMQSPKRCRSRRGERTAMVLEGVKGMVVAMRDTHL